MPGYLRPVTPTGICTWYTHTHRVPPSQEAGVDYYTPIGTPVHAAAAGRVFEVGGSIYANTGRFVTIDLDDGRRVRYLHLSKQLVTAGIRVNAGDIVGKSGASGYGSEFFGAKTLATIPANTGGPHVHTTLWPRHVYSFGPDAGTLDFEKYVDHADPAGGGATPFPNTPKEDKVLVYPTCKDATARKTGRSIAAGGYAYLNTELGKPYNAASNVVGGVGPYVLTAHIYAEGTPGDVVELAFNFQKAGIDPSDHYLESAVIDKDGKLRHSVTFQPTVQSGYVVYLRAQARKTNKGPVKVTVLDADAYLFVQA